MSYQRQSETPRKGEAEDHKIASIYCENFIKENNKYLILKPRQYFRYPPSFRKEDDYPLGHEYDLVVAIYKIKIEFPRIRIVGFIEFDGKTGFKVKLPDGTVVKGTPTKHDRPKQKINDGIAREYVRQYYHEALFYRIEKGECFNPEFLREELKELLAIVPR